MFDDVTDSALDAIAGRGFDWVWLMGVWQTGDAGRAISQSQPVWRREFEALLPDLTEADIPGSPFAVQSYTAHRVFGGDAALARLRERLRQRGVRLMLDFVPNHTARDHLWVREHPEFYIGGSETDLAREPQNYCRLPTPRGPKIFAYGRDPFFPGWPDTLQLNYRLPTVREAMLGELSKIVAQCDGLRCDMAMLLLPDVIEKTWGDKSLPADGVTPDDSPFWPVAIRRVRKRWPSYLFMAETYWDLEWTLQQQGFDSTYDKRLYDRLRERDSASVRGHLHAQLDFQKKSARFLENHDEPRAADAFPIDVHRAAAVIAFLLPGVRFFHEGQFEGRRKQVSVHLGRRPQEPVDQALADFYQKLLECLKHPLARDGQWQLLDCRPAWEGNSTADQFVAFAWENGQNERLLTAVNYGPVQGQCYVELPWPNLVGKEFRLRDRLSDTRYDRAGDELLQQGLYLDMPAWQYHVFEMDARDA
jgi:glycosidase